MWYYHTHEKGIIMEIYKINNISDFLKEGRTNASEITGLKGTIESYINNFFAPNLNIHLDMNLNLLIQGEYKAIFFDQMALLRPLAEILDVNISYVKPEELVDYLTVRLQNRITELKGVTKEEELIVKFPHLSGIYHTKKEHIEKSVGLEQGCKTIKPAVQAEHIKAKKLQEFGISRTEHANNLIEAYSFNLAGFLYSYYYDLERVVRYLEFLKNNISQAMMPVSLTESLDEEKINEFVKGVRTSQKERGLK